MRTLNMFERLSLNSFKYLRIILNTFGPFNDF